LVFEGDVEVGPRIVEVSASTASLERRGPRQLGVRRPHSTMALLDRATRVVQCWPVGIESSICFGPLPLSLRQSLGELRALAIETAFDLLELSSAVSDRGGEFVEPLRHFAPRLGSRLSTRDRSGFLGKLAALGDGRQIGALVGEDSLEDVPGFFEVARLGDDGDDVPFVAAAGADVQASPRRSFGDELDADGRRVALDAVLGGGVAEPDVLSGVLGG
jgi:hypothetical protein